MQPGRRAQVLQAIVNEGKAMSGVFGLPAEVCLVFLVGMIISERGSFGMMTSALGIAGISRNKLQRSRIVTSERPHAADRRAGLACVRLRCARSLTNVEESNEPFGRTLT